MIPLTLWSWIFPQKNIGVKIEKKNYFWYFDSDFYEAKFYEANCTYTNSLIDAFYFGNSRYRFYFNRFIIFSNSNFCVNTESWGFTRCSNEHKLILVIIITIWVFILKLFYKHNYFKWKFLNIFKIKWIDMIEVYVFQLFFI